MIVHYSPHKEPIEACECYNEVYDILVNDIESVIKALDSGDFNVCIECIEKHSELSKAMCGYRGIIPNNDIIN